MRTTVAMLAALALLLIGCPPADQAPRTPAKSAP